MIDKLYQAMMNPPKSNIRAFVLYVGMLAAMYVVAKYRLPVLHFLNLN